MGARLQYIRSHSDRYLIMFSAIFLICVMIAVGIVVDKIFRDHTTTSVPEMKAHVSSRAL